MKLIEAIRDLDPLDDETTIYAAEPWTENSEAIVIRGLDSGRLPADAEKLGLNYLLEVFIAREVLEDLESFLGAPPTLQQKVARVIEYAINDA
jgi:hypothetical protein